MILPILATACGLEMWNRNSSMDRKRGELHTQSRSQRMDSFRTEQQCWHIPFTTILGILSTLFMPTIHYFIILNQHQCNNKFCAEFTSIHRHVDFDISLLAFVHPNVSSSRPLLTQMGFQVIVAPTPINTSAIRYEFLRTKIDKNGCCGASELIKINSYRLIEYDYVVHLDADTYLLNPIDELFEFPNRYSLQYTTDPNMASHKGKNKMPVQGNTSVFSLCVFL